MFNLRKQLAQDRFVAERDGLTLTTVQGDMADLSMFAAGSFDLVFHPVSNTYVPEIRPVWAEAFRVLRHGGLLLAGFINPISFIFDDFQKHKELVVKYPLPYSELTSISDEEREQIIAEGDTLQFSHTFDDQIGGQLDVGFLITGFFEDRYADAHPLVPYMPTHFATRAIKP
jgi:SAM-dependent methyltransferase